jgi:hypothetical protein
MKFARILIILLFAVLIFTACESTASPTNTLLPHQSPTITGTPLFINQTTRTTPISVPTLTLFPTSTLDPTRASLLTQVAVFPGSCSEDDTAMVSPDGNWLANDCRSSNEFAVMNRDGSKRWTIPYSEKIGEIGEIFPRHWSPDNRYIYFYVFLKSKCCIDGVPDWGEFVMSYFPSTLYRMDIQSGIWTKFISGVNYTAFSPTGRRFFYVQRTGPTPGETPLITIAVLDLKTGEEFRFNLVNYLAAGYVIWSEDGQEFILSTVQEGTIERHVFNYKLYMVDTETKSINLLYSYDNVVDGIVFPVEWDNNNILSVKIVSFTPPLISTQLYNLNTYQPISSTSTP